MIGKILKEAIDRGACAKANSYSVKDWDSLARLFFSPQGTEFCLKHEFPSLEMWREIKQHCDTTAYGIFIDEGDVSVQDSRNGLCFIGMTRANVHCAAAEYVCRITVCQGAIARIEAKDYSVVKISKDGKSNVKVSKDNTSIIL